jgi:hypothetical protein
METYSTLFQICKFPSLHGTALPDIAQCCYKGHTFAHKLKKTSKFPPLDQSSKIFRVILDVYYFY